MLSNNPSVTFADSSPYTGEPTAAAGLLNGKSLYGTATIAWFSLYNKNPPVGGISVSGIALILPAAHKCVLDWPASHAIITCYP